MSIYSNKIALSIDGANLYATAKMSSGGGLLAGIGVWGLSGERRSPANAEQARQQPCKTRSNDRGSHAAAIADCSIRVLIDWRRPNLAVETSPHARADRTCLIGWPGKSPCLTGRTGIAEARATKDDFLMFLYMPATTRLGWCDHRNHDQSRRVCGQCQKPDRKFAHAYLLTAKDGICSGSTYLSLKFNFRKTQTQKRDDSRLSALDMMQRPRACLPFGPQARTALAPLLLRRGRLCRRHLQKSLKRVVLNSV